MKTKLTPKAASGSVMSALFAALISCAFFFSIPLPGGVPIVLQDSLAMLSGLLLGPLWGGLAVFVFLALGCLGLPVFSGKAGYQIIVNGATGGFLVGYLLGAVCAGIILRLFLVPGKKYSQFRKWALIIIAAVCAVVVLYVSGIIGFIRVTHKDFQTTLKACVLPFLPVASIKLVLNVVLTGTLRNLVNNALYSVEVVGE